MGMSLSTLLFVQSDILRHVLLPNFRCPRIALRSTLLMDRLSVSGFLSIKYRRQQTAKQPLKLGSLLTAILVNVEAYPATLIYREQNSFEGVFHILINIMFVMD